MIQTISQSSVIAPAHDHGDDDRNDNRRKLLIVAYSFHPSGTMEERNGWMRAVKAAQDHFVTVLYRPIDSLRTLVSAIPHSVPNGQLQLTPIDLGGLPRALERMDATFYFGYRAWHRRAFEVAKKLHAESPFDLAHMVSLCGYREPGFIWKLPIPHVWGPIGGAHNFPVQFSGLLDPWNALRESVRSVINYYQLRYCRRIRAAARASTVVVATRSSQHELRHVLGNKAEVDLETGIEQAISPPRSPRNPEAPLRILWAGRFREWKALPLLLYAIKELPSDIRIQLRIVGHGQSQQRWARLAQRYQMEHNIEWIARPRNYRDSLQHYDWADVFAFTSLRDTSGTGLLDSLAAGTPIIGVDHQGAADIMTDECAIRVPVTKKSPTIQEFARGLTALARDPELWLLLSHGATRRAAEFTWEKRHQVMSNIYERLLKRSFTST